MPRINNIRTDRKKNAVEITVNPAFYPIEIIEATAEKFSAACNISKNVGDSCIKIVLKPKSPMPLDTIGYEFMNHLLADLKGGDF